MTEQNETQTLSQEERAQMRALAKTLMVVEKKPPMEIRTALEEKGVSPSEAYYIVDELANGSTAETNTKAKKDMIFGALWCVGGLLVTIFTYSAAQGGGRYVVAWGAIIFGGFQFFRGVINNQNS